MQRVRPITNLSCSAQSGTRGVWSQRYGHKAMQSPSSLHLHYASIIAESAGGGEEGGGGGGRRAGMYNIVPWLL